MNALVLKAKTFFGVIGGELPLLYSLVMPKIMNETVPISVETLYFKAGDHLGVGQKLFDVCIDLSARFEQNCPPISYYRVVSRERVEVLRLDARVGDRFEPGALLGLCGTDGAQSRDAPAARPLRVSMARIWHERDQTATDGA